MTVIKVGMADLKVIEAPGILTTLGLGSCVGIALYDHEKKIAGLTHAMLPFSNEVKNNENKAKFVDSGIKLLIEKMLEKGASKEHIVAKIVGGSQMFSYNMELSILKIGERNILATKKVLKDEGIRIISEDIGGNYGRTIQFNSQDGSVLVKTIGHGVKII